MEVKGAFVVESEADRIWDLSWCLLFSLLFQVALEVKLDDDTLPSRPKFF